MRLTRRQQAILDFIRQSIREQGYPPSVREIGEAVGLASSSTVHGHLARLQSNGYLRRDPTKPRAIVLNEEEENPIQNDFEQNVTVFAPLVGRVTAGQPITAEENIEEYFPLPKSLVHEDDVYMLKVQGDSMMDAGIFDGDFVIVKRQNTARNGDIVVAMTEDDEATVKRFFREADHIRLQPENASIAPMRYSNVKVLGLVIGLFRSIR